MATRILLVEDETEIAELVSLYLKNEGYTVDVYSDGGKAQSAIEKNTYDLAILDVMLPNVDGFRLCGKIRENQFYPVIMLTAKVEDIDKVFGLTIGADDYITKPFNPLELIARVKTQLRRFKQYNLHADNIAEESEEYDINGLLINRRTHEAHLYNSPLNLTPIEFSILLYLAENRGKVVSSEELFESVWKEKYLDNNNTVMAHIARIRDKMGEKARNPKFIKTIWGVGYKIEG